MISNRVAFAAAGASTVIVSNSLVGVGVIAKRGTGRVELVGTRESALKLGNVEAGGLTVAGDVEIAEDSVMDVSSLDFTDETARYELLRTTGTVTGFDRYSFVGMPADWKVRQRGNRYVLGKAGRGSLIVIR